TRASERAAHHECDFGFHDEACEARSRDLGTAAEDSAGEEKAAHRLLHLELRLPLRVREAGLPPDQTLPSGEQRLAQPVLNRVGLGHRQAPLRARRRDESWLA